MTLPAETWFSRISLNVSGFSLSSTMASEPRDLNAWREIQRHI